jgi:PAP2 superfamily
MAYSPWLMRHLGATTILAAAVMVALVTASTVVPEVLPPEPPDDAPAEVAVTWFDLFYDVVKAEQMAPPPAARLYGLMAVALYEALAPGSRLHRSLAGQLNDLAWIPRPRPFRPYHWPTVANTALASTARGLLPAASPSALAAIDALEQTFAEEFQARVRPLVSVRSAAHGRAIAEAVLAWAATDGFVVLNNCPYIPPVGRGLWQPTPPAFVPTPVQPCWGQLRPFVLPSGEACAPPPPPVYAEDPGSEFYAHARAVYDTGRSLTEEQRTIAQFWADNPGATGTPPGHWIAIMSQLARADALSLMAAAEGFARVGIAVADAFIGCWQTKYTYNLLRPVTYIQHVIDPTWVPYLSTPPFPEYTSGHATQSAAAAAVLTAMLGIRAFTDTTHTDHNLIPTLAPRTFSSFDEAAAEAALSRVYAGIHFPFGSQQGLVQGRCIGQVNLDRLQFTEPGRGLW